MASWSMSKPAISTGPTWGAQPQRRFHRTRRLDGSNRTVVPQGVTHAKAASPGEAGGKLYWCDREGMRVCVQTRRHQRRDADPDGRGRGRQSRRHEVVRRNHGRSQAWQIYWTQGADNSGLGRIFRAGVDVPKGETRPVERHRSMAPTTCPNRSTSSSTSKAASSTGRTRNRRSAIPSIVPRSSHTRKLDAHLRSSPAI